MKRPTLLLGLLIVVLAGLLAICIAEVKGDFWEESIRKFYYQNILKQNIPSTYQVAVDSEGIPFIIYETTDTIKSSKRYLPTTICLYAIKYYQRFNRTGDSADYHLFFNCLGWLSENISYKNGYAGYEFDWQQPYYPQVKTPWHSGLSNGWAIKCFLSAYQLTHDSKYMNVADELMKSFYVPIEQGGFTIKQSKGWWYEEYAFPQVATPKVLNGHIYALLGVYRFWRYTKNDSAKFIFTRGLDALETNLAQYDVGNGWSYYDRQGKIADKQYQKIIVELMQQLYSITGNQIYRTYYEKWNRPLSKPYFIRVFKESNRSGYILLFLLFLLSGVLLSTLFFAVRRKRPLEK